MCVHGIGPHLQIPEKIVNSQEKKWGLQSLKKTVIMTTVFPLQVIMKAVRCLDSLCMKRDNFRKKLTILNQGEDCFEDGFKWAKICW